MVIGTPAAPAGLALPSYERPVGTPGAITITGVVWDGAGEPVPDALVETWQADPVLRAIADPRRATLIAAAQAGPPGAFRFDIHLQGDQETVFFDV